MFSSKVIIVTGAGSGIGRGAAIKMASLGALVAITDINGTALAETVELCQKASRHSTEPVSAAFDIGDSEAVNSFIAHLIQTTGRIDFVLNNAGINPTAMATADVPDAYWDKMINTNLKGTFNMTRAAIPHLKAGAVIVNVSSISGQRASPGVAVYCATKFGIIGFTKCVALELGPKNIRCNAIAPGHIITPSNASVRRGREAIEESCKTIGMRRMGEVEEIVNVLVFMFSPEARYMNGSVVEVNGGQQ
jgi:NAD(P)-dependent dehydrogenase (short-subunit alcohol dehydrogenase family)